MLGIVQAFAWREREKAMDVTGRTR